MPTDWTETRANVEALLRQADDQALRATAVAFVEVASVLTAPCDVGLGYWRTSLRFSWASQEIEVFAESLEIYRLDAIGVDIVTITFAPGNLPEVAHLFDPAQQD